MIFHEDIPPTLVYGVPDGLRADAEEFWDLQRELTAHREERERWQNENRLSILKWERVRGVECKVGDVGGHGNGRAGVAKYIDARHRGDGR